MEATRSSETSVLTGPNDATSQKTALFVIIAVKISNPAQLSFGLEVLN
jgi:hypothetical protein